MNTIRKDSLGAAIGYFRRSDKRLIKLLTKQIINQLVKHTQVIWNDRGVDGSGNEVLVFFTFQLLPGRIPARY